MFRSHLLCFLMGFCLFCSREAPEWTHLKEEIRNRYPDVPQMTTEELARLLEQGGKLLLIDARSSEEYSVSHLAGSLSANDLESALELVRQSENSAEKIVVYCSVGYRSSAMASRLQPLVDRPVFNLEGSIFEWANEGRPVFRAGQRVEAVHPYNESWGQLLQHRLWQFEP